jgi:hypothetical protein
MWTMKNYMKLVEEEEMRHFLGGRSKVIILQIVKLLNLFGFGIVISRG